MNLLVTGGTGTLGNAIARWWLKNADGRLLIYSRDEEKQWRMRGQLIEEGFKPHEQIDWFIGDVRDRARLTRAMQADVDAVIHAAAMKQVDTCEYNPIEAVRTNIGGTQAAIDAALDANVGKLMLISSDKAVHPVNLYGMTKGCAEKLVVHSNVYAGQRRTRFAAVRYGNVVGSRGSFFDMLRAGPVPIPITDERMTRFWFGVEDAVRFVMEHVRYSISGGEIFVPKMRARSLVELAALARPRTPIEQSGMRPGEKLHETLICSEESRRTVEMAGCYIVEPENPRWPYKRHERAYTMQDGWEYTSETAERLSDDEARRLLEAA